MPAPGLLTLAAREVADGEDLDSESLSQLVLLLREMRAAEKTIEVRMGEITNAVGERASARDP